MKLLPCIALCLLLAACGERRTAAFAYQSTPVDGWERKDSLCFPVDTVVASGRYVLSVGVRTSAAHAYLYRDVALQVVTCMGGSRPRVRDVVCHMADAEGDASGSGMGTYQYVFSVDTLQLHVGQAGTLVVRHVMRDALLMGITDVGVRLRRL